MAGAIWLNGSFDSNREQESYGSVRFGSVTGKSGSDSADSVPGAGSTGSSSRKSGSGGPRPPQMSKSKMAKTDPARPSPDISIADSESP